MMNRLWLLRKVRQCGNLQRTRFALAEAYAGRLPQAMVENYKSAALSAREVMNFVPASRSSQQGTGQAASSTTTFGAEHADDAEYHREQARVAARAMQRIIKEKLPRTVNQRGAHAAVSCLLQVLCCLLLRCCCWRTNFARELCKGSGAAAIITLRAHAM